MSKEFRKHGEVLKLLLWSVEKEPTSELERTCWAVQNKETINLEEHS